MKRNHGIDLLRITAMQLTRFDKLLKKLDAFYGSDRSFLPGGPVFL